MSQRLPGCIVPNQVIEKTLHQKLKKTLPLFAHSNFAPTLQTRKAIRHAQAELTKKQGKIPLRLTSGVNTLYYAVDLKDASKVIEQAEKENLNIKRII